MPVRLPRISLRFIRATFPKITELRGGGDCLVDRYLMQQRAQRFRPFAAERRLESPLRLAPAFTRRAKARRPDLGQLESLAAAVDSLIDMGPLRCSLARMEYCVARKPLALRN